MNYYEILRLSPQANMRQISSAIENLRKMDKAGNYTATLQRIESTLSDPQKRAAYDQREGISVSAPAAKQAAKPAGGNSSYFEDMEVREAAAQPAHTARAHSAAHTAEDGFGDMFVDIDENYADPMRGDDAAHFNKNRNVLDEMAENSVLSDKNQRRIKTRAALNLKPLLFLILLGAITLTAFIFSKPLLEQYNSYKQVDAAMAALDSAEQAVKDKTMASMGVFPAQMNIDAAGKPFTIAVNGTSTPKQIILTFTGDAAAPLAGQKIYRNFIEDRPNITFWQCSLSAGFPADYQPAACR